MNNNHRLPMPLWILAGLGLAWNIFGVVQFLATTAGTVGSLMNNGMTAEQAQLYLNLPAWMTIAFAVGVFGGALGSVLLLVRHSSAVPILAASLLGYVVLYVGDITEGVFAAFGMQQVVILTTVVLIAAALLWLALRFKSRGYYRNQISQTVT